MIQNTPCVESLVTSVGPDTFTADVSPGVRMQVSPDIHGAPGNITLRLSTTDQKRKQTVEQSISQTGTVPCREWIHRRRSWRKARRSHHTSRALIPNTTRFPSSQPVPPFLPFPTFFLSLLACAVFSQPVRAVMTVQLLPFPFRKESLMPQQHPGRLQILVVDAHCKRRLFSTKTPTDPMSLPDVSARRITVSWWYYATTDFCSDWSVLPAATAAGTRAAAPAISIYRTGCRKHNKTKDLVKTGGGRVLFS